MLYAVIDIGSHSVRLMLTDGKAVEKKINTTRLVENVADGGYIQHENLENTAKAVADFHTLAKKKGAFKIFIFATEAVRSAKNGNDLISRIWELCGATVNVLDKSEEAEIGFLGAYKKGTCCVVDVGGGSTEISVGNSTNIIYSQSIPYGIVRLTNMETNGKNLLTFIPEILKIYGQIPPFSQIIAIGGTAGAVVSILTEMKIYNPNVANGYVISAEQLLQLYNRLKPLSVEERKKIAGLPDKRADVIDSGILMFYYILKMLKTETLTVSEGDNLEGFLIKRRVLPEGFNAIYQPID